MSHDICFEMYFCLSEKKTSAFYHPVIKLKCVLSSNGLIEVKMRLSKLLKIRLRLTLRTSMSNSVKSYIDIDTFKWHFIDMLIDNASLQR